MHYQFFDGIFIKLIPTSLPLYSQVKREKKSDTYLYLESTIYGLFHVLS